MEQKNETRKERHQRSLRVKQKQTNFEIAILYSEEYNKQREERIKEQFQKQVVYENFNDFCYMMIKDHYNEIGNLDFRHKYETED